jgi:hypothetical protein
VVINIGFIGLGSRATYLLGKEDFGANRVVAVRTAGRDFNSDIESLST